jgi:hypothetical protein
MKNKIIILAIATIFSIGMTSAAFSAEEKAPVKMSCKKQAKSMKFKDKSEKKAFLKECKEGHKAKPAVTK